MKKALLVAPQPMYEDRGTPIALRQVLQALSELGHRVDVLTFPVGRPLDVSGVRFHRVPNPLGVEHVPVGFSWKKLALDVLLTRDLFRMVGAGGYDWIHAVEEAAFPAIVAGRRHGVPVLYDMQSSLPDQLAQGRIGGSLPAQTVLRGFEGWLLRRADLVVSSQGLEAHVRQVVPGAPVGEWPFPAVAPFVEDDEVRRLRSELHLERDERVVLYTGTFEPYQGLDLLLDAAASVVGREPRTRFVLVGGDEDGLTDLRRRTRELGIGERVTVLGREPRERVWDYLALADVVVSPRCHGDNMPIKILDYMALAKPIVATCIPAHTEVLDGLSAELVEPTSEGMARGILTLLNDPARARARARAAGRVAEERFGWKRFVAFVDDTVSYLTRPQLQSEGFVAKAGAASGA